MRDGPEDVYRSRRLRMVAEQLRARGLADARVLDAMSRVPREAFVPRESAARAYDDAPVALARGQTVSQPYMVAATLEHACTRADDRLLDVGTGSGYAAAVASLLVREVVSVERIPELADAARARLARLGYANVVVLTGDGSLGVPARAPFDVIVAAAAAPALPAAWRAQLREGGRIVAPVGAPGAQRLVRATLRGGRLDVASLFDVRYVPLVGAQGFDEDADGRG